MIAALIAVLLQGAAPQSTEPETPATREIIDPDWRRVENPGNPLRFYPERAQRLAVEGAATISCVVDASGRLQDCRVLDETPAGYGFGEAALRMKVLFRMKPLTRGGQPVDGGVVRVPIRFRLPR